LVGNKSDMSDKRKVTFEEGQELAKTYKIGFLETSAKNASNIDMAFQSIAKNIIDKMKIA
jgi:Ras-related protein Rab-1A